MKIIGAVFADFLDAPAGGPSQLATRIAGEPILARTLARVRQIRGLAARCLFVRPRDRETAAEALGDAGCNDFELLPLDTTGRPRRALLTAARKWNLSSWRGGLLGSTWFDEFVEPQAVARVLAHFAADAVFCFDGHQPVLDADLATAMVDKANAARQESKMTFCQAPPGLAGLLLRREGLQDFLEYEIPVGLALSYRPELAQTDPIVHEACYQAPAEIIHTRQRFTGDTQRSREIVEEAIAALGDAPSALDLCRWTRTPERGCAGPLPLESEIELTTADPLPDTTLRPRGDRVARRALADIAALDRVAAELASLDDRLVWLGGHGDPLQHPHFAAVCRRLRAAGVYGLGVATPLVDLREADFNALFEYGIDVVEVQLDALDAETYRRLHNRDAFEQVRGNIARVENARRERRQPRPIVACSMTRCSGNIHELEGFYDYWIRETGAAVIRGFSAYSGALPDDSLLPTWPPDRGPCRRLDSRLTLLADGSARACDQDLTGQSTALGNWLVTPLREIWGGERLRRLRAAQQHRDFAERPACRACTEWNRP